MSEFSIPVVREGTKIVVPPEPTKLRDCAATLLKLEELEEQLVNVNSTFNAALWDGARALNKAMIETFGVVLPMARKTVFGENNPEEIEIEVEFGKTERIKWGQFELPGMEGGAVATGVDEDDNGQMVFRAYAKVKRKYQARVNTFLARAKWLAENEPMHKGKAFTIQFTNEDGEHYSRPAPKFFPLSSTVPVFRRDLENAIERNIFVPIELTAEVQKMGEPLKRGTLFAGRYGMGKTLLASYIASKAIANGWTFIYCKKSEELPEVLKFAQRYQPVVVFAEDLDRVAGVSRTNDVNKLLNQLDGIDSKQGAILTVLTTNHPESVNEAMRRPGRIDLILEVMPPDAEAVGRLVKLYAGDSLEEGTDLSGIQEILAGFAPAHIREAVGRAKLEALRRTRHVGSKITGEDLAWVAGEVVAEANLFRPKEADLDTLSNLSAGLIAAGNVIAEHTVQ